MKEFNARSTVEPNSRTSHCWRRLSASAVADNMENDDGLTDDPIPESLENIMLESMPKKSRKAYEKAWTEFRKDERINDGTMPNESNYLRHFSKLRKERKLKGSTLWSMYSRLNAFHSSLYGKTRFSGF